MPRRLRAGDHRRASQGPGGRLTTALVGFAQTWYARLAGGVEGSPAAIDRLRLTGALLLLRTLEVRGLARDGGGRGLAGRLSGARDEFGAVFAVSDEALASVPEAELRAYTEALSAPPASEMLRAAPIAAIGQAYEQCLALAHARRRRAGGVYYTPRALVASLLEQTLGVMLNEDPAIEPATLQVIDPACGAGAFLFGAFEMLAAAQRRYLERAHPERLVENRLPEAELQAILERCIVGIDLDADALEVARFALRLALFDGGPWRPVTDRLAAGNALLAPPPDGFDAVIGNPPWGQKAIEVEPQLKRQLQQEYPSAAGIFDWFRPFVELGVRLARRDGTWGMVLPDIVLLKNYEPTRRLLLETLTLTDIRWLGMAFSNATIDVATIAGRKRPAPAGHPVRVVVSEPGGRRLDHFIEQRDFAANPRATFNLTLTRQKRAVLDRLGESGRLGDYFEAHEGIHSGNMRAELFVGERLDDSCRELLFGRDELRPYALRWDGRFVRLSAIGARRTRERYANIGQIAWYEQDKILVRRTGDRITAAVDRQRRFASNNFFLIIARDPHPLSLDGLCALLNSSLATWWFRTVEPRKGRVFAEVKIKHLVELPVLAAARADACEVLNQLGAERSSASGARAAELDRAIDARVPELFGVAFDLRPS